VSVIVPTYNRASLVGTAVRSVLRQAFTDLEVLVVDDGSTDDTERVVRDLADPRVHYCRLPKNRGQAAARNEGLRRARGEFLAFQDSDDRWVPGKLGRFMSAFRAVSGEVGCVYSDMQRFWADGRISYHTSPVVLRGRWIDPKNRWYQVYRLGIQAAVIRRRYLEAVGPFDETLRYFEDMELFMRLAMACDFVHIPEPLTEYVQTGGVSQNMREMWRARRRVLHRHGAALLRESPRFVLEEGLRILRWRLRG
jgi:glycosyltransferase involved in cell wall biosynthesis